jgi:hypothetical protein
LRSLKLLSCTWACCGLNSNQWTGELYLWKHCITLTLSIHIVFRM